MITKRERKLSLIMIFIQVLISICLFVGLELFFRQSMVSLFEKAFFLSQIALIWSFLFYKFRLGIIFRASTFGSMIRGYLATISLGGLLLLVEYLFLRMDGKYTYSIYYFLFFCVSDLIVLIGFKYAFFNLMNFLRRKGYNSRQIIIVADAMATPFIDSFINANDWGYRLVAIISPDPHLKEKYPEAVILPNQEALGKYITLNQVDDIFYCLSIDDQSYRLENIIREAEEIGVSLHIMEQDYLLQMSEGLTSGTKFDNGFVTHQTTPTKYLGLKIKDAFDLFFSTLTLILLSPCYVLIALLIKMEDGGPVLFKQERIGLNGRRFVCFKFRSMIVNAEDLISQLQDQNESDGPTFKIKSDPRITKIGRILRKTSLDELPQFYNVIKGEMSIVGPRPPLLREVQQYERSQLRRLSMKPGITCKWQVEGRNEVSFKEWMQMDLDYIDNWSIATDLKIIIATVGVILKANGR